MKKNELITKIMSANVATVQLGQPLSDVRKLMCSTHFHHIPIVEGKKLLGLVSFTDLMKINLLISGAVSGGERTRKSGGQRRRNKIEYFGQ